MTDDTHDRFALIAVRHLTDPAVTEGTGFGSQPGLRINGKIFAMLVNGELVVKLPRARVDELVERGQASRFDPGHGRLMKEWASVPMAEGVDWEALADEARAFVEGRARRSA
jgi:hypothetical protein